MATLSPSELLNWLGQNQFLTAAQGDALAPLLVSFPDSLSVAKELLRRDWLTPYQVNQIMQGKHEQLVLGSYRLRERIGEGAMGQIFKAWSLRLERIVAVKTITKELINNEKAMDRFRREVETASHLDHPNICLTRDAGDWDGKPFLVMDFIEGIDLSRRVKQSGVLPIYEAVEYTRQAALGLQHAFERGVVHRDIKPANLIVIPGKGNGDGSPLVKILDFGLARFETENENADRLTQVGKLLGTIDYIAPEQATDARTADIRADIYSLGCSLFYLLTGRPPFPGKDMVEKLGPRVTGEPPWVRTHRADVPPGLEEVLRKMMARRPDDRYQTPIQVVEALQAYAVALAIPVSAPVSAGVALALPINSGVPAQTELARAEDPAFLGMSATGRDLSSGASAATPHATVNKAFPIRLMLIGGAVVLFSMVACACVFAFFYSDGKAKKKPGILRISKTKWSMGDEQAIPGKPHHVLVWIERVDCKGPVKITLKDLPAGVSADVKTLAPNALSDQVRFIVSYGTGPLRKEIKVYAESEEDDARAEVPMLLVIKEDPLKKRKK